MGVHTPRVYSIMAVRSPRPALEDLGAIKIIKTEIGVVSKSIQSNLNNFMSTGL